MGKINMDKYPLYRVTIDSEEEELGIDSIANTSIPAIQVKGMAFNKVNPKNTFSAIDDMKMRIVAPVMIPGDIYRNEEGEEYLISFEKEDIEVLAKDFMSKLSTRSKVFNDNHTDNMLDSYILEAYLVDSEAKQLMLLEDYNLDVILGSFVIVQQFNNKEEFARIVAEGKTGFSIEGYLGKYPIEKQKSKFNKMKKKKFVAQKRVLKSASRKQKFEEMAGNEEILIIADEIKEGEEVVVLEDIEEGFDDNFTGEVDVENLDGEELIVIIEDGVIDEVIVVNEDEEEKVEEVDEVEMEEEVEIKEKDIDFSPLVDLMLEIKEELVEIKKILTKEEEEEVITTEVDEAVFNLAKMRKRVK